MNSRYIPLLVLVILSGCSDDQGTIPSPGPLVLPPAVIHEWGRPVNYSENFFPLAVRIRDNVLFFLESDRLSRFTLEGSRILSWEWAPPWPHSPTGFDEDVAGNLYVAFQSRQIRVHSSDGTVLRSWPVGTPVGDFNFNNQLGDIALDGAGHLYVVDTRDRLIRKYDLQGNQILQWGDAGEFQQPTRLIVHTNGNIIVLDRQRLNIQVYTANAELLNSWQVYAFDGNALAEGPRGTLLISDNHTGEIVEYALNGTPLNIWGHDSEGFSFFVNPIDVVSDGQGKVFVCDHHANRVTSFTESGGFLSSWDVALPSGAFQHLSTVAAGPDGSIFVLENWRARVQKFSPDGTFLTQWGPPGRRIGQLYIPTDLDVDGSGNVFVTDVGNNRVTKFDGSGHVLAWWYSRATGIAVSSPIFIRPASIYEVIGHTLHKRDLSGTVIWENTEIGFEDALDVCVAPDRQIYILDRPGKVFVIDEDGHLLRKWLLPETTIDGRSRIAVDLAGRVLITAPWIHQMGIYTSQGHYLDTWTGELIQEWGVPAPGSFRGAAGLDVDTEGNIILVDWSGYQVKKFAPIGASAE